MADYPKLEDISYEHKQLLDSYGKKYGYYSDFNFTSLYSYNVSGQNKIALFDNNLVITLQDYTTGNPYLTFLGDNNAKYTIDFLLQMSETKGYGKELKLVPEVSITAIIDDPNYTITEDRDSFDYICSTNDIAELRGNKYFAHRNLIKRLKQAYPELKTVHLELADSKIQKDIFTVFSDWQKSHAQDYSAEESALQKLFELVSRIEYFAIGVYIENQMIGYSIEEILDSENCIGHFEKADKKYKGIYQYLENYACKHTATLGIKYLNLEQDLGIPGLRKHKTLWRPINFLKKYTVKKANN